MTIANEILSFHKGDLQENGSYAIDYTGAQAEAEAKAIESEQDYEHETTTYVFADGSVITDCNGTLAAYGSRD